MPTLPIYRIRPSCIDDASRVTALLQTSYPALLVRDYPSELLRRALPKMCVARPELLRSGSYYVAEAPNGQLIAAGGWSWSSPVGGALPAGMGHIRHVVTHPEYTRRGVGRAIMAKCFEHAEAEGITRLECISTRTAVPFYEALGLIALTEIEITLGLGVRFPAVQMTSAFS